MIISNNEMKKTLRENIRGGTGQAILTELIPVHQLPENCKIAATLELYPGCSIGVHEHVGEAEIYYCIAGTGTINDNGSEKAFSAGDVSITYAGGHHGLFNTGDGVLLVFAFIINTISHPM
jgi:quercetin dioxygenase-like cupin family protein